MLPHQLLELQVARGAWRTGSAARADNGESGRLGSKGGRRRWISGGRWGHPRLKRTASVRPFFLYLSCIFIKMGTGQKKYINRTETRFRCPEQDRKRLNIGVLAFLPLFGVVLMILSLFFNCANLSSVFQNEEAGCPSCVTCS